MTQDFLEVGLESIVLDFEVDAFQAADLFKECAVNRNHIETVPKGRLEALITRLSSAGPCAAPLFT